MAFPGAIAKAFAIEPNVKTGTIKDVEHVVILMQENRSFDHYYGTMNGVRGYGDPRPWKLPNGKDVWYQPTATEKTSHYKKRGLSDSAEYVLPFNIDAARTKEAIDGTNHGWSSGHLAWNEGRYDQWVHHKQDPLTMAYLDKSENSYHRALANAFTICDSYFCSIHADTAPNRIYLWTGTIDATNTMGRKPNGPGLGEPGTTNGYTWTTYPERLEKAGVSWKLYQGGTGKPGDATDNYTDNSLEFFANFQKAEGGDPTLIAKGASNHTLKELAADVLSGNLPAVSWVVSPYKYCEHPSATTSDGASYIDDVLTALTADPEVWSKTVFIINYDENDGLFDHVVPPMPPIKNLPGTDGLVSPSLAASLPQEILDLDLHPGEAGPLVGKDPLGKQPIGLGPRVPLTIVSPWTKGGWVCSEVFDHTSVLRFLEKHFDIAEPNISAWRRSLCGDLTSAFDFKNPSAKPLNFPRPTPIKGAGEPFTVPADQQMPQQEAGQRPARALGYKFDVVPTASASEVSLTFTNTGSLGCYFYVRDAKNPAAAPRRYQIAAGESVADTWKYDGEFSLGVWGANGFLAEFAGPADRPDIRIVPSKRKGCIDVVVNGQAGKRWDLNIDTSSYESGARRSLSVQGKGQAKTRIDLASSNGWFYVRISEKSTPQFLHRVAGHLETGAPSFSDPLLRH